MIYFACSVPANSHGVLHRVGAQSLLALCHKPSCSAVVCSALEGPHFTGYVSLISQPRSGRVHSASL